MMGRAEYVGLTRKHADKSINWTGAVRCLAGRVPAVLEGGSVSERTYEEALAETPPVTYAFPEGYDPSARPVPPEPFSDDYERGRFAVAAELVWLAELPSAVRDFSDGQAPAAERSELMLYLVGRVVAARRELEGGEPVAEGPAEWNWRDRVSYRVLVLLGLWPIQHRTRRGWPS